MFILNPQSGIPIYRQVVDQVRRMVASGQLVSGSELPSVRELAVQHAVNPMTISKAYALLENEGLLIRQRGKPMQVAAISKEDSKQQKQDLLTPAIENLLLVAKQLDLDIDELLLLIKKHVKNKRES
ncbi:MAG: GntR family transcriptional regulator [Cellvibrio sp.]|nr:GntR family transcriptional regulator [Cellvibrio sp.]